MNERIKELAERAEKYADDNFKGEHFWTEAYESKFAELIVRECLDACSRANEIRHFVPPTQEQVVLSCMREIEKHFGVEE
jgi:hypothetical protein